MLFPQDKYATQLEVIQEVTFTRREIDIIACILSGKTAKKIASFLSIAPKTVENHIRNLMLKLRCNSQESIIDFIEKSNKFNLIKKHYSMLLIHAAFESSLKKISLLENQIKYCILLYEQERSNTFLLTQLSNCLKSIGLSMISVSQERFNHPTYTLNEGLSKNNLHIITVLAKTSLEQIIADQSTNKLELSKAIQYYKDKAFAVTFLLEKESDTEIPSLLANENYLTLNENDNFYFFIFEIIQRLLPSEKIAEYYADFKKQYDSLYSSQPQNDSIESERNSINTRSLSDTTLQPAIPSSIPSQNKFIQSKKKRRNKIAVGSGIAALVLCCLTFVLYNHGGIVQWASTIQDPEAAMRPKVSSQEASLFLESINKERTATWALPRQDHLFIGREAVLATLNTHFVKTHQSLISTPGTTGDNSLRISVCAGLGGIGKTQIALQYAHHTKNPYRFKAWFSAENIEDLQYNYTEFANAIGFKEKESKPEVVLEYIKNWLSTHPGWLLVLDNVNNYEEIKPFLPEAGGHVLITTRQRQWPDKFNTLLVDVMSEQDASTMISSILKRPIREDEINASKELIQHLGSLPLALAQASAYIQQSQISINEYLGLFKKYEMKLLTDNTIPQGTDSKTVALTWNITLHNILEEAKKAQRDPIELEILRVCSYLAPEKIPQAVLLAWLKIKYPELPNADLALHKYISLLWQYSLLEKDESGLLSLHRLVQTVVRDQHQKQFITGSSDRLSLAWFNTVLESLHQVFQQDDLVINKETRQNHLLPHLQTVIGYHESLWPNASSDKLANILSDMASVSFRIGDPKSSKSYYEKALHIYTQNSGRSTLAVSQILRALGNTYRALEDKKSKDFLEEALAIQKQFHPENHVEIALTKIDLANAYGDLGEAKQKQHLLAHALPIIEQHFGQENLQVAQALYSLARVYIDLGNYSAATPLFTRALAVNEKQYGKDHPNIAVIVHNFANNYLELGDFKQALILFERAYHIKARHFGANHPQTAITLHGLGRTHIELGNYQKAKTLFEDSLKIKEQQYGKKHRQTMMVYHNLGNVYKGLKARNKAEELLKTSLEFNEKQYGKDHIWVALTLCDLGDLYAESGDLQQAKPLLERGLQIQENFYGRDHLKTAKCLYHLAKVNFGLHEFASAKSLAERSHAIFLENYGKDNSYTKHTIQLLNKIK